MDGIINIYKEKGFTSHDVVAVVRRTIGQKKVGHTGTLDPDATGVLPVCVGKATKLADYIMASEKTYVAEVTLGAFTDTQDSSGNILERHDVDFDEEKICTAVNSFIGNLQQTPPMYSAIKINGKKLYELAREGKEVERKKRNITIFNIEILSFNPPDKFVMKVDCSKGTYIRTLCDDIGRKLGCGAYMSSLERTRSGSFVKENSITLDELKIKCEDGRGEEVLLSMEKALEKYKRITVSPKAEKLLYNGAKIYEYFYDNPEKADLGETAAVFDSKNNLVGLYTLIFDGEKNKACVKPVTILL